MPLSQTPAYNLKAVLKETGIAADTLRAWERRYGIPMPERTPGGHRLYSQRDIHLIKWLLARQEEGLSISRAVEQWNSLTASGADPLAEARATSISTSQVATTATTNLDALQEEWVKACLAYDEAAAEQILNQAFALYPVELVATNLIQRGLDHTGELWYRGDASVQQEHFASALAARRLDALIAAAPAPHRKETLLLACPPDEWHAFPLLLLSLLFRRRGWNVVYLGANVPTAQLEETLHTVRPAIVVMAAQQLMTAATLRDTSFILAKKGFPLAYGGRIFNQIPELRAHVLGEFLGEDIQVASELIEQLVEKPIKAHSKRGAGSEPSSIAAAYRLHRRLIESALEQRLAQAGPLADNLAIADLYFGNALEAALRLGNIAYLETDLDWIKILLTVHTIPAESLRTYLTAYAEAMRQVIGKSAAEASDWLEGYSSRI